MATALPVKLKSLNNYLKTASELEKRDPVVAYYCRLYAVQKGMELDNSKESKIYLMGLLDVLEKAKQDLKDEDSMMNETVGQAHVEQYALKLFSFADKKDRDADFGQATIKAFITSGFLMDVLTVFGEVGEDIEKCRKYAKWKAVYINQCLKNGEAPHPGPLDDSNEISHANQLFPSVPTTQEPGKPAPVPGPRTTAPPKVTNEPKVTPKHEPDPPATSSGNLSAQDFAEAEKCCKYALSSLQYQDTETAKMYLHKCLDVLNKK